MNRTSTESRPLDRTRGLSHKVTVTGRTEEWVVLAHEAEAHPDDPHRWLALAESLTAGDELERARAILLSQSEAAGKAAPTAARLCRAWIAAEDLTGALKAARSWVKAAPMDARAHAQLADILMRHGDADAASIRLRAALMSFPQDTQLRLQYAEVLADREQWQEALTEGRRVLDSGEGTTRYYALLAKIFGALGRPDERLQALRAAVSSPDRDRTSTLDLARELAKTGADKESLRLLEQTAEDSVGDFEVVLEVGRAFLQLNALEQAEATLSRLAADNPERFEAHLELGRLYRKRGRPLHAIESLERAISLDSSSPEAAWEIGLAHRAANHPREAAGALIKAAAALPDNESIQAVLAETLQNIRPGTADLAPPAPADQDSGFNGDLSVFSIPELLEFLVHQRASGELSVRNASSAWIVLELFQGTLVGARGSHTSPILGWILERNPGLNPNFEALNSAGEANSPDRTTLSELLASELPKAILQNALEERSLLALRHLLSWEEGRLRFDRADADEGRPSLSVETRWALLETMRLADEQQRHVRT